MHQNRRLQWLLLRIRLKKSFQNLGEIVAHAVGSIIIILPPLFAYFILMADTYSTVIGLHAFNMVESNPKYAHYNERGITGEDIFNRQILATIYTIIFLIVGSALFTSKDPLWFWGLAYLILWVLLLIDLITLYSNLLQIAAKI